MAVRTSIKPLTWGNPIHVDGVLIIQIQLTKCPEVVRQSLKRKHTTSVKAITDNSTSDFYNFTLITLIFLCSVIKKIKMENKNYHRTIVVNSSVEEAMKKISKINLWWRKDFSGTTAKLNDKFTVPFGELNGEISFVDFVISEFVPDKKVVWKVTNCNLPWFKDKKEWNNTEVVFKLSEEDGKSKIDFTHIGLVPEVECYEACEKGWDGHITNDLEKFINEGKAIPQYRQTSSGLHLIKLKVKK